MDRAAYIARLDRDGQVYLEGLQRVQPTKMSRCCVCGREVKLKERYYHHGVVRAIGNRQCTVWTCEQDAKVSARYLMACIGRDVFYGEPTPQED